MVTTPSTMLITMSSTITLTTTPATTTTIDCADLSTECLQRSSVSSASLGSTNSQSEIDQMINREDRDRTPLS